MADQQIVLKLNQLFLNERSNYEYLISKAQKNMKTRTVHDLRVNLQKLAIYFELQKLLVNNRAKDKTAERKKRIQKLKKRMSHLRDYQVQRKIFSANLGDFKSLKNYFDKREKNEVKRIKAYLKVRKLSNPRIHQTDNSIIHIKRFYSTIVFKIQKKMSHLKENSDHLHLHELRKDVKHLMYLTGITNDLGIESQISVTSLKNLQKMLGEVQDVSMTIQTLNEFLLVCPHKLRLPMVDYRLENELHLKNLILNSISRLERSELWPN
jgi:CHAD domain-containing protein